MLGWFSDEIARASRSKPGAELLASGLDGDGAAQSRVYRPKHFAHAALAEFAFDAVWAQASARSDCR